MPKNETVTVTTHKMFSKRREPETLRLFHREHQSETLTDMDMDTQAAFNEQSVIAERIRALSFKEEQLSMGEADFKAKSFLR